MANSVQQATQAAPTQATAVASANNAADKGLVTYAVAGQDVKLSYKIVRDYLVKGGGNVSDQDLVQFISICKYNQLNPFLNEAYLVKFGTNPATMVVSKEALMKRADACPNYAGIESGVIVVRDGNVVELDGCFYMDNDVLVGGWAKVYRTDRRMPVVAKVRLADYDKKQSVWNSAKATMIAKVAKVQALREAFPAQLGAMYTQEEQQVVVDADYTEIRENVKQEKAEQANKTAVVMPQQAARPEQAQARPSAPAQPATPNIPETPGF